jgi:predicted glycogen debranching enzyme
MGKTAEKTDLLPQPIIVRPDEHELDELLATEWLLSNRIGAYACSTVLGCNTRRYHGLLVAATVPPVGRIVALASVMERVVIGETVYELATNEFEDTFSPEGMVHLVEFRNDVAPTFVFRLGEVELVKRILLAPNKNAAAVQYTFDGHARAASGRPDITLHLRPFAAMRDFHSVREADRPRTMIFESAERGVMVQDRSDPKHSLYLTSQDAGFQPDAQWWNGLRYRTDESRGAHAREDIYSPGVFTYRLDNGEPVQFNASLDHPEIPGFETTVGSRRQRLGELAGSIGEDGDETTRRLGVATDAFVVNRPLPSGASSATILAGFPWFADWGRDAFIALPGLLLTTKRYELARQVFSTFAGRIGEGMIPNRFDDYSSTAHYNSIDASLWFIIAAERYLTATGDQRFWADVLSPAAVGILQAYQSGTRFDIHADADSLLTGGSADTQLTWMDAKIGGDPVTARHGKSVEVNALWYAAHRIMGQRSQGVDNDLADYHSQQGEVIASSFVRTFWNAHLECLYDCVRDGEVDYSTRPNQVFAVSLPYSPLSRKQQVGVLNAITEKLLTPFGLRTLAPDDPRYCGVYGCDADQRNRGYHQGTVWAWLLGPYIEAYLKLHGDNGRTVDHAEHLLEAFDGHLCSEGVGFISEIFDGDPPHHPHGCIAQGWSVGEILRAKQLVAEYRRRLA